MNLDDFGRVAAAALQSIETLLGAWLPNGVRDGQEFCVGSRDGEAGKSMRIRLTGDRAGRWSDFSGDAADAGGDLISLYAYLEDISQGKACVAIAEQLGIVLADTRDDRSKQTPAAKPPLVKPRAAPAPATGGAESKEAKPRTEWTPLLPVPDNAGPYPKAHPVRGKPERVWEYRDQQRRLQGIICRFIASDGGKEILPCTFAEHPETKVREWRWIAFREPRPLYLPAALRDGFPVLVVEGEKCADAAQAILGELYDVVSWPGGGKAVQKADWSALAGRAVTIWADADAKVFKPGHASAGQIMPEAEQPGMKCAIKLAGILAAQGATVRLVDIPEPGAKPDGWDIADLIEAGAAHDEVLGWVGRLRIDASQGEAPPPSEKVEPPDDDAMPDWVKEPPEGASTPPSASADILTWKEIYALLIKTDRDTVKGCRENVFFALSHDPRLIGIVALDQFSNLQIKRRMTPWKSEPGEWTERDDFHLGVYLAKRYYLVVASISEIEKAVAQSAHEHAFNPVIDYMTACHKNWDGTLRVEKAFSTYWGAVDSPYMRCISSMFFTGLVKRAFVPGVKHDCAPVFEGGQGEGKSTALAVLGGEWFADTPFRMGEKDGYLSIQGILIYEVAELEQFNRSETTAIKAFMSSLSDRYREPYGRRMKNMPRRTVFAATTNEGEYFKDTTGNRRFWPVEIGRMDLDALRRDRDQLFGEAVELMRNHARWYPTREEQDTLISPEQEKREIADPWLGRIYDYLEGIDADGKPMTVAAIDRVTGRELLTRALHIEIGKLGPAKLETMRIAACMRKLGWTKGREAKGARERFYERPVAVADVVVEPVLEAEQEEDDYVPL